MSPYISIGWYRHWLILASAIRSWLEEVDLLKVSAFFLGGGKENTSLILIVCLHQSPGVCWPSNMMSLLIPHSLLTGCRRKPSPHSRGFLSCCIGEHVHFALADHLDFFKVLTSTLYLFKHFFISSSLPPACQPASSPPHCSSSSSSFCCRALSQLLCLRSGSAVLVSLLWEHLWRFPTYLPRYTLKWM